MELESTKEYYLIASKWWGLLFSVKLFGSEGHVIDIHWISFCEFIHIIWCIHDINAEFEKLCIYIMADV